MSWDELNKQYSSTSVNAKVKQPTKSSWDDFNAQMTQNAFRQEATSQTEIDPALYQQLKSRNETTKQISTLAPEKTSFIKTLGNTVKDTLVGFGGQMLRTIRGTSQVLATPIAGALALPKGGVTPSQAMNESLKMAKDVAYNNSVSVDKAVEDAGQMWLKNRGVGKYGGKDPDIADVAALGVIQLFNLFGDPAFEFGALKPAANALKEFATFKKVGAVTKDLKPGTSFVKGTQVAREIKISNDLKVKIKPQESSVVFEGYKRRFPTQKALPDNQLAKETEDLIVSTREATGMEVQAKFNGDDLILKPTQPIAKSTQSANPLLEEAKKYKSAEEFVSKITDDLYNTKINKGIYTDKTGKQVGSIKWNDEGYINYKGEKSPVISIGKIKSDVPGTGTGTEIVNKLKILADSKDARLVVDWVEPQSKTFWGKMGFDVKMNNVGTINENGYAIYKGKKSKLTDIWNEANAEIPKMGGELKQSKLGVRVKEEAIEDGLVKQMRGLPEYETMNMKEQAKLATDLINFDLEKAKRIAMGEELPEGKLLPESVFIGMKNWAKQNKDVKLLRQLAKSHTVEQATFMGQRIRALGETDPNDPVKIIRDIEQLRAKKTKGKSKEILTEEQKKIQREIKAVKKSEKDLEDFIQAIKC